MPKVLKKRKRSASSVSNKRILKVLESLEKRIGKIERRSKVISKSSSSNWETDMSEHSSDYESPSGEHENQLEVKVGENPATDTTTRPPLNSGILSYLAREVDSGISKGPPIHQNVGNRWIQIIKIGLDNEARNELVKKFPSPENAQIFSPPKLNPPVERAILNTVARRDQRLESQQHQIGISLSAIGKAITILLDKEEQWVSSGNEDVIEVIELLNDTGRLLADSHHIFSVCRRELASLNLDKDLKDSLLESPIDEWLFGEDLNDRLKTEKDLQASSKQLLSSKQPQKNAAFPKKNSNLNGPHRNLRGARRGGYYRQTPVNMKKQLGYQKRHRKYQDESNYQRH